MFFRQVLNDETACASYVLGCASHAQLAVVDPHVFERRHNTALQLSSEEEFVAANRSGRPLVTSP
jgi:hypothetical protein